MKIYNYIFNYGKVKCCNSNCNREMYVKNPNLETSYSCSMGCTFEAFNNNKNQNKDQNQNQNQNNISQ